MATTVFVLTQLSLAGEALAEPKRLTALPIRLGRNALNDVVVNHGAVSSFHARIEDVDGRLCVTDLFSKNGVYQRDGGGTPRRLPPNVPVDLQPGGFELFLGVQVRVSVAFEQIEQGIPHRGIQPFTGQVVGNQGVLMDTPSLHPTPQGGPLLAPHPGAAPPAAPGDAAFRGAAAQPVPAAPFQPAQGFPGAAPQALPGSAGPGARAATGILTGLDAEAMALVGLRELAASLVPGSSLESTGDIARFITKIHDTLDAFCRSFIPLREGHAQFMSSFDLQRSLRRSQQRSQAYLAVEGARTPEALAAALLNPKDRSFDAPRAIEGILADLMLHQLALLEGVMRGVGALLEELSPEAIERQGSLGSLPLGRHRALWNKYCEVFENLAEERQAFAVIFGPEFTAAYRQYRAGGGEQGGHGPRP